MASWKSIVGQVAPTIASALGGPLAGTAMRQVAGWLGLSPEAKEPEIAAAVVNVTPEKLIELRQIEADFKAKMAEVGVDLEKIAAEDRASARARQVAMKDWTPNAMGAVVLLGFLFAV